MVTGIQDKEWADKFSISFLLTDYDNEIQQGATMAKVIGEAKKIENSYSPAIHYTKNNVFVDNLQLNIYSSFTDLTSTLIDTSSRIYDWKGSIIDEGPKYSELGFGNNGKSLLTLQSHNFYNQAIIHYTAFSNSVFSFSYTNDHTKRSGNDIFEGDRTAGFRAPQTISKQISALSFEQSLFEKSMTFTIWGKNYDFRSHSVDQVYITDSKGYRPIEIPVSGATNNWGYGIAAKYEFHLRHIFKLSSENAYRLPDVEEILGDGLLVRNNPSLSPEYSYNYNVSYLLSGIELNKDYSISCELTGFYRDVNNLILYIVQDNRGIGVNENIGKVIAKGISTEVHFSYKKSLELKGNATYQDIRDNREYIGQNKNETFGDRLRNTPYLLANGGIYYSTKNIFSEDNMSFFWDIQYVHEFYLNWPSLGMKSTKAIIPTQLINDIGVSYSIMNGRYNMSVSCTNLFDNQVYDNYLIQKPGRAFSTKFRVYFN